MVTSLLYNIVTSTDLCNNYEIPAMMRVTVGEVTVGVIGSASRTRQFSFVLFHLGLMPNFIVYDTEPLLLNSWFTSTSLFSAA